MNCLSNQASVCMLQAADFFADEGCMQRMAVALDERLLAPSAEAHEAELMQVLTLCTFAYMYLHRALSRSKDCLCLCKLHAMSSIP
jgi:hypothetical protein